MQDLNLRPSACKAGTLPTELIVQTLEQHTGLEPVPPAWKAEMLPITPVLHLTKNRLPLIETSDLVPLHKQRFDSKEYMM